MTLPIRNGRVRLPQGQIFWREVGRGVPVVFLHDTWADGSEWLPVAELLAQRYHCLAPDLLGFGDSERPRLHYSIALEVECLAAWLDALKLRQIYLVGAGVGAWVAASFALHHEETVQGLVLLDPEGIKVAGAEQRWRGGRSLLSRIPLARGLLSLVAPVAKLLGWQSVLDLQQRVKLWRRSPAASQILFNRRPAELQAEYLGDRVPWLKLPLLLLHGDADPPLTAAQVRAYAEAPMAQVQELPGRELLRNSPVAVAQSIHQWLKP